VRRNITQLGLTFKRQILWNFWQLLIKSDILQGVQLTLHLMVFGKLKAPVPDFE